MSEPFDLELQAWLREGPDDGPQRVLDTAFVRARATRQRPTWLVNLLALPATVGSVRPLGTWSVEGASRTARALLLAVLLVALVGAVLFVAGSAPRPAHPLAYVQAGHLFLAKPDGSSPHEVTVETPRPAEFIDVRWAPDYRHLEAQLLSVGSENDGWLAIIRADGQTRALQSTTVLASVTWAPDGTRLAVVPPGDPRSIAIVDLDERAVGSVAVPAGLSLGYGGWQGGIGWSPDGRSLAVPACFDPCNPKGPTDVFLLAVDGSEYLRLSHAAGGGWLAWSPRGQLATIGCAAGLETCSVGVRVLSVDGTERSIDTLANLAIGWVAWSPDGTRLAVAAGQPGGLGPPQVLVVEPDGEVTIVVSKGFDALGLVEWSSDGGSLVFQGSTGGDPTWGLWSIAVDGKGEPQMVVQTDVAVFDLDARP